MYSANTCNSLVKVGILCRIIYYLNKLKYNNYTQLMLNMTKEEKYFEERYLIYARSYIGFSAFARRLQQSATGR